MAHSPEIALPDVIDAQSEQDDTHLVIASQQGDQDAFASLVQRHQRRVFTLALRMLQDYDEASEITQETFLAAWMGLPSFRGEARFATWLYRIAYHGRAGNNVGVESWGVYAVCVDRPVMLLLPLFPAHEDPPERLFLLSFSRSRARIPHL